MPILSYNAPKLIICSTKERQGLGHPIDPRLFPGEVLDKIFEYLLVSKEPIHISRPHERGLTELYNIAVFRSCQLMKERAYCIFFGKNSFEIDASCVDFFYPTVSAHLRDVKVHIDYTSNIPDFLQAIQRCKELRRLSIQMFSIPMYRGSENPRTFVSLKFKKLPKLTRDRVEVRLLSSRDSRSQDQEKVCAILQNVLQNGQYVPEKEQYALPEKEYRRSKRIKR